MQPTAAEDRAPYVDFIRRGVEDRDASIKAGHYVSKDVDFARITPFGSKDCIEQRVDEWLKVLEESANQGRIPKKWPAIYREAYQYWQKGLEIPLQGTSIRNWPVLSPAQVELLTSLHLLTIEDVAAANEEAVQRMGMAGRALKQRAMDWMAAATGPGKVNQEITALRVQNQELEQVNKSLREQNNLLQQQLQLLRGAEQTSAAPIAPTSRITSADLLDEDDDSSGKGPALQVPPAPPVLRKL